MPPYVEATDRGVPTTKLVAPQAEPRKHEYLYFTTLVVIYMYISTVYGFYLACTSITSNSIYFTHLWGWTTGLGVTAGAHRLWSHRSYKAKMPLQIILMILHTATGIYPIITFARDHRLHHKYSDTDADPHNATRGFLFSHVGWLCVKRHPEAVRRRKLIDVSDLWANPVVRFQRKYSILLTLSLGFVIPILIQLYFFEEPFSTAYHHIIYRQTFVINVISLVNSAAHLWGNKPYDKKIKPTQNYTVAFCTLGEGFHNYHHVFPLDYRTAELGNNWLNFTTKFIDFFAWIGWAYDLKVVPEDVPSSRALRSGDGSDLWGFERESDMKTE